MQSIETKVDFSKQFGIILEETASSLTKGWGGSRVLESNGVYYNP